MQETPGSAFRPSTTTCAAPVEGAHHLGDLVLRAIDRGNAGKLARRIDAGPAVDGQLAHLVVEVAAGVAVRPDRPAHAPAGHRPGLRPAVEDDQPVADFRELQQRAGGLAVIGHDVVDLVGHDGDMRMRRQSRNQLLDLGARRDAAGRIGRRVEDQEPVSSA